MKTHLIFYLLFLIFTITSASPRSLRAAESKFDIHPVKKIEANPINLALILIEHTDSTKVASILDYHGYTLQAEDNGYKILKDSKGHEIRYSFAESNSYGGTPSIVVKTRESSKSLDSRLKNMKFGKVGNGYERIMNQYSKFKTTCTHGPNGTLLFRRSSLRLSACP